MIIKDNSYLNLTGILTFSGAGCQDEVIVLYYVILCHYYLKYSKSKIKEELPGNSHNLMLPYCLLNCKVFPSLLKLTFFETH